MKDLLKTIKEDKVIGILILTLIFLSECGIYGFVMIANNYDKFFKELFNQNIPYILSIFTVAEWILFFVLIIFLFKTLLLVSKEPLKQDLILKINKIVYSFTLLTIISVVKDTVIGMYSGVTVFFLPMSDITYIFLIFTILTYLVRCICKKAIEIKDYQDLTI